MSDTPLLEVSGLSVEVERAGERFAAVDDVSFAVARGEALGLVGESGCGKTMTLRAVMGLLPAAARVSAGTVRLDGAELRGRRRGLGMVFQDPLSALNPVMTAGAQGAEAPRRVLRLSRRAARARAVELLRLVGVPDPERRARAYPHELSGGTRQRVMIALALSSEPEALLCDEPTTALDVTIQADILRLLADLRARLGLTIVFVTHDLAVMAQVCREVAVMYAGRLVEVGPAREVLAAPRHPYTLGLLRSVVDLDAPTAEPEPIPGALPDPLRRPPGCPFHPRCPLAGPECEREPVPLIAIAPGRLSACLHHDRLADA
jgi:peptide/nickel transport system ATP-binding protein